MNISCVNTSEFKKILELVEHPSPSDSYARSNIELIMRSESSRLDNLEINHRKAHFLEHRILLDPKMLISTMDQNFMSVLEHSFEKNAKMSTRLIFEYIFRQEYSMLNYNLLIKNLNDILER